MFADQHLFPVRTLNNEPLRWDRPVGTDTCGTCIETELNGWNFVPYFSVSVKNREAELKLRAKRRSFFKVFKILKIKLSEPKSMSDG